MAEIQLKTMKFPGIEDTYTIPSIPSDIGAASAINIGTYTGDINSLDLPLNSVAYISQNAINNPFPTEGAILETWGGLDGIRVQRATRCTGHHVLVRTYVNNAWHDWAKTALVRDLPNPNLLDNWYFADPINQRGATEYTAEGFTIDRWKMSLNDAVNPSLSIGDGCIVLHNETTTGTPCSCFISQRIENPSRFAGKTITFSVKLKNVECAGEPILQIRSSSGNVRSATITSSYTNSIIKVSTTLDSSISSLQVLIGAHMSHGGDGNFTLEIESAKLEVGSISTLANDAPPKKSEQLLECQRYYIRWSNTAKQQAFSGGAAGTAVYAAVQLPTAMRGTATPTVTSAELDIYNFVSNGAVAAKSCGCNMLGSRNSVVLWVTYDATSACPGQTPASIRIGENGYIALSCEI